MNWPKTNANGRKMLWSFPYCKIKDAQTLYTGQKIHGVICSRWSIILRDNRNVGLFHAVPYVKLHANDLPRCLSRACKLNCQPNTD